MSSLVSAEVMAQIELAAKEHARVLRLDHPERTEAQIAESLEAFKNKHVQAYSSIPGHLLAAIEAAAERSREASYCRETERPAVVHEQRMALVFECLKGLEQRRQMLAQVARLLGAKWPTVKGETVFHGQRDRLKLLWRFELPGVLIVTDGESGCLLAQSLPARLKELDLNSPMEGLA